MITSEMSSDLRRAALEAWLTAVLGGRPASLEPASADASFRRYFRVWHGGQTLIAMDAPPDREDSGAYIRVAAILAAAGVNVPRVLDSDLSQGFLLLTDLGSCPYLDALRSGTEPEGLYRDAIAALLRIQSRALRPAASLAPYDAARLRQEMLLFPDWFLARHLELALTAAERVMLDEAFDSLVQAALAQPQVLVHRDYHSRNLMVCDDNPGILDFQDAVRGASSYDLVSLLKDCYICWPRQRVLEWLDLYREGAAAAGVPCGTTRADFITAFDLMGLQRHLKVLGIFARLWYRDGKPAYLDDLPLVLDYALEAAACSPPMRALLRFLHDRVVPAFAEAQRRVKASA
jgi:aminoglycoside/choline kinase family phosphotransferase